MGKFDMVTDRWNGLRGKLSAAVNTSGTVYEKVKRVIGILIMVFYRLRKIFLAVPVVYYALKLAGYNMKNLPEQVGINLQADGAFAQTISRELAVMGPLGLTCACLVLMLFARRALPSWAICVFTLALPVLLLVSNIYPA